MTAAWQPTAILSWRFLQHIIQVIHHIFIFQHLSNRSNSRLKPTEWLCEWKSGILRSTRVAWAAYKRLHKSRLRQSAWNGPVNLHVHWGPIVAAYRRETWSNRIRRQLTDRNSHAIWRNRVEIWHF
jgi:hypothetical protein